MFTGVPGFWPTAIWRPGRRSFGSGTCRRRTWSNFSFPARRRSSRKFNFKTVTGFGLSLWVYHRRSGMFFFFFNRYLFCHLPWILPQRSSLQSWGRYFCSCNSWMFEGQLRQLLAWLSGSSEDGKWASTCALAPPISLDLDEPLKKVWGKLLGGFNSKIYIQFFLKFNLDTASQPIQFHDCQLSVCCSCRRFKESTSEQGCWQELQS